MEVGMDPSEIRSKRARLIESAIEESDVPSVLGRRQRVEEYDPNIYKVQKTKRFGPYEVAPIVQQAFAEYPKPKKPKEPKLKTIKQLEAAEKRKAKSVQRALEKQQKINERKKAAEEKRAIKKTERARDALIKKIEQRKASEAKKALRLEAAIAKKQAKLEEKREKQAIRRAETLAHKERVGSIARPTALKKVFYKKDTYPIARVDFSKRNRSLVATPVGTMFRPYKQNVVNAINTNVIPQQESYLTDNFFSAITEIIP